MRQLSNWSQTRLLENTALDLLKIESRTRFSESLEVGMQFEGVPDAEEDVSCR